MSAKEAASRLAGSSQVWADIRSEGRVVHGVSRDCLESVPSAQAWADETGVDGTGPLLRGQRRRRLLPLKTRAEYEPDEIAPSVATKALERAQRCAATARRMASTVR